MDLPMTRTFDRTITSKAIARRKNRGSIPIHLFMTAALLAWPGSASLADSSSSIETFVGGWKGDDVNAAGSAVPPDGLRLRVQSIADGFRISWRDLGTSGGGDAGGDDVHAHFQPTNRPGVYEYAPKSGSLLTRMFASPTTGNPLMGETLLWARIDGPTLAVYSMKIDPDGGFDLDHYSWTRSENGLRLTFSKRTEDVDAETKIEGELVAEGG